MTTTATTIAKFEIGKIYTMSFIGDADLKPEFTCIKKTEKTATFKAVKGNESFTKKVKIFTDSEYVLAGSYSMAPCIRASRVVVK